MTSVLSASTSYIDLFSLRRDRILQIPGAETPHGRLLFSLPCDLQISERWKFSSANGASSLLTKRDTEITSSQQIDDLILQQGEFKLHAKQRDPSFEGQLCLITSTKRSINDGQIHMKQSDYDYLERELGLHPSTLQYIGRDMKGSRFWTSGRNQLSKYYARSMANLHLAYLCHSNPDLILSFPVVPVTVFKNISTSYDLGAKITSSLISTVELGHFTSRSKAQGDDWREVVELCHAYWAHPLLVPTLLLDIFMHGLEHDISDNIHGVEELEAQIRAMPSLGMDSRPLAEREDISLVLTELHDTLKYAIKLLDAARWTRRSAQMLLDTGHTLHAELTKRKYGPQKEWHDIQNFLEDMVELATHLEPDPVMTQQRCQSQIDILQNKIAQEDNLLAARMAVSASRDSSAMKVLAVITAIFLPGSYIATLFSMSMFNWQANNGSSTQSGSSSQVVMSYIWIYWVVTVLLTILVVVGWRVWWTIQDREFRRNLPQVVRTDKSEVVGIEKVEKNILPRSFVEDLLGFQLGRKRVRSRFAA